jgi:hypothetical protein
MPIRRESEQTASRSGEPASNALRATFIAGAVGFVAGAMLWQAIKENGSATGSVLRDHLLASEFITASIDGKRAGRLPAGQADAADPDPPANCVALAMDRRGNETRMLPCTTQSSTEIELGYSGQRNAKLVSRSDFGLEGYSEFLPDAGLLGGAAQ